MTALREGFYLLRQLRQLFGKVLGPAKALASDGAIEAFDKALLVLLVRTRDPVLFFQEVGALFPAAVVFSLADGPDKLLGRETHLTGGTRLLFDFLMLL